MHAEADRPHREQCQRQMRAASAVAGDVAADVIDQADEEDAGAPRHVGNARVLQTE